MPIANNETYKAEPLKPKELRGRFLTRYELETVINFNKEQDTAIVFTYEKSWQKQNPFIIRAIRAIRGSYFGFRVKKSHLVKTAIRA